MANCLVALFCVVAAGDSSAHLEALRATLLQWQDLGMEFSSDIKYVSNVEYNSYGKTFPPGTLIYHKITNLCRRQGSKFYIEFTDISLPADSGVAPGDRSTRVGFDGDLLRIYTNAGNEKPNFYGQISANGVEVGKSLYASGQGGDFLRGTQNKSAEALPSLLELISDPAYRLDWQDARETIDGRPCLVLKIQEPGEDGAAHRIWIDTERGYNYLRWDTSRRQQGPDKKPGKRTLLVQTRVHGVVLEQIDGRWFPTQGALEHVITHLPNNGAMTDRSLTVALTNVKLGKTYSDADFFVTFPPGTRVQDGRATGESSAQAERTPDSSKQ
ncbi:MAG: hypothetical protein WC655_19130 [Candidatus Hydrogenedentales bacterium]